MSTRITATPAAQAAAVKSAMLENVTLPMQTSTLHMPLKNEDQLTAIVTRESMIGVSLVSAQQ